MSADASPIDISVIKGLIGDDEDVINIFFNKFIDAVPDDINEIIRAIDNSDFTEVKAKSHKLKSSAKAVGANYLGEICQKIEDESDSNSQATLYELSAMLNSEFTKCKQYIQSN